MEQTSASMSIQEELQRTQFLLSEDSLLHSAEYHSRLEVLKELNYVDGNGTCKQYLTGCSVMIAIHFCPPYLSANEGQSGLRNGKSRTDNY